MTNYILSHESLLKNTRQASGDIVQCFPELSSYTKERFEKIIRRELRNKWVPSFWFDQQTEKLNRAYKQINELNEKLKEL